jgi:hypothetical protein
VSIATLTYAFNWQASAKPILGIVYWYYYDDTLTITSQLERMKADGFQIVCIPFIWDDNPQSPSRVQTDVLFSKASQLGLKVYVRQPSNSEALTSYLAVYGNQVTYMQVINEADTIFMKEWTVPSDIVTASERNAETVKKFNSNIKTLASFATPLLPNLISSIAQHVDIIALDIYEQIQLDTFPIQMQTLLTLSGKNTIWIGEFGHSTINDQQQAGFIQKGLNLFKTNGVETVIIWSWNANNGLNIKGRQAETTIKTWEATG